MRHAAETLRSVALPRARCFFFFFLISKLVKWRFPNSSRVVLLAGGSREGSGGSVYGASSAGVRAFRCGVRISAFRTFNLLNHHTGAKIAITPRARILCVRVQLLPYPAAELTWRAMATVWPVLVNSIGELILFAIWHVIVPCNQEPLV